jgi:acetyl esterase/lipase
MELMSTLFERVDMTYKTLNGVDFPTAVLVPKNLKSTKKTCPLLVHFHGGGLYTGTYPEPAFLSGWYDPPKSNFYVSSQLRNLIEDRILELAAAEGAIIVSPAYRLLPESNGSDIIDDIIDFWSWIHTSLATRVAETWPHLTLDVDRAAAVGESAGGYLCLQSAFLLPAGTIKVVIAQYCALYSDIASWNPRPADGGPAEARAFIDKYISSIPPGGVRLSSPFPAMSELGFAMRDTGSWREWMGDDERTTLEYGLRTAASLPPLWIMQGTEDHIVSFIGLGHQFERTNSFLNR